MFFQFFSIASYLLPDPHASRLTYSFNFSPLLHGLVRELEPRGIALSIFLHCFELLMSASCVRTMGEDFQFFSIASMHGIDSVLTGTISFNFSPLLHGWRGYLLLNPQRAFNFSPLLRRFPEYACDEGYINLSIFLHCFERSMLSGLRLETPHRRAFNFSPLLLDAIARAYNNNTRRLSIFLHCFIPHPKV